MCRQWSLTTIRLAQHALDVVPACRLERRGHGSAGLPAQLANLKTWLLGTHHGVGAKHLPHDVDEFVFRFNRRRTPMAAFQSLLGLTTHYAPTTYQMLYAAEPTG